MGSTAAFAVSKELSSKNQLDYISPSLERLAPPFHTWNFKKAQLQKGSRPLYSHLVGSRFIWFHLESHNGV